MKKTLCALFAVILLMPCADAFAQYDTARSICVLEAQSGDVVYEKNAYEKLPPASTTKIMTALVALEECGTDDVVTVSENAAAQEGSSAYLKAGDKLTMLDLLYGLMLNSGNDAAVAVAEYVAGGTSEFADMMNEKTWEIGASDTQFTNPNGLPDDNHYTTAHDLAVIARYAMQNSDFKAVVSAKKAVALVINTGRTIEYYNHNRLLSSYDGCTGVKTGYTKAAGRCLVSAAERDNMSFVAVTLNDPNDWRDHADILDACFSEYTAQKVIEKGAEADSDGSTVYGNDVYVTVKNGTEPDAKIEAHVPKKLKPPLNKGEKVGYAEVKCGDNLIARVDVLSARTVYKTNKRKTETTSFWYCIYSALKGFF